MAYEQHVCGPANILDTTAVVIDQVEGQAYDAGIEKLIPSTAGQVYPTFTGIMQAKPKFSLSTQQVAEVLAKIGVGGLVLATGFEVYNQLTDTANGLRKGSTNHEKLAITTGVILPRQLRVSQGRPAVLSFDVLGTNSSGLTHPVTRTGSVALPSTSGIVELFTLGPVKINGTAYEGIQDLTIDFGIREEMAMGSGAAYPQRYHASEIRPKVSIRTNDAALISALGVAGTAQGATDSVLYLRKMTSNGVRLADGTAEHVSFSINAGLWLPTSKGGSHPGVLETAFECEPIYDGSTAPVVLSTAAAIS